MKLVIASDLHGSAYWTRRLMDAIAREAPDRVVLLGDLLYHGPRNDLPRDYAPKQVIPLLNDLASRGCLTAVRGNCEAEVDQMVRPSPVCLNFLSSLMRATARSFLPTATCLAPSDDNSVDRAPSLPAGSALVYGHTHIKVNQESGAHPGLWLFNPGSVSIPKDGTHSYGIYQDGAFSHVVLDEE